MYDYQFKIILVGDTGTGKSCTVLQLCDKRFEPVHDMTIGVEFATTMIDVDAKKIKLQIWDTAGQESFYSITRSYYRGSAGIIIMYDITRRNTFTHVQRWVEDVRQLCHPESSILIIGNKSDLEHRREVTFDEGQQFASRNKLLFCECSAKTTQNMDLAFSSLVRSVLHKLDIGIIVPGEDTGVRCGVSNANFLHLESSAQENGYCCGCT